MNQGLQQLIAVVQALKGELGKVIIGQHEVIDRVLVALLTGQHALIEGVPGIGKTLLVRTLAKVVGGRFSRIQFTPDLMPTDITGSNIFNMKENEFVLNPGPIFCNFLLADEINRAPSKTQSALLQAMQERLVTIDRKSYTLPASFTVFATQNPVEFEGTYPLPEAQKDRFMLKITMPPPTREEELALVRRTLGNDAPETVLAGDAVRCVINADDLVTLRQALMTLVVQDEIAAYALEVVRATRSHQAVLLGGGPRASQSLILAARAAAAVAGRDFITPDDIKMMALPVLEHRLILQPDYEIEGLTAGEVIGSILQEVTVPR
ncbi:MAG: MoxR family ATPase [Trichlorobacter sp.]|uniref:AAA family ATPase n=1 Tax=Trichlorobacter sp. TaxID=2911007 RepID=UPI00256CF658|nr:MoxR family ATPase [Trichlorobacter sp.]MDK9716331.1 MoxR family ATPase [Trichlorobacter sp.]